MTQLTGQDNSTLVLDRQAPMPVTASRWTDHLTLTKPRITFMVVVTAIIGFALAPSGHWSWLALFGVIFGTALSCMGASVLNQVIEREPDGMMNRTRDRPLPAGRLTTAEAAWSGIGLSVIGVVVLWVICNELSATLSAATILSYTLLYTPMKRVSPTALLVGAVPGAMPPMIGYAAATGELGPAAWLLFSIMFVWQVPHFLAIAWLYRKDYAKAGFPMLPVLDPSGERTFRQILIGCLTLLPLGLLPTMLGVSGMVYFFTAMACGLMFLACGIDLVFKPSRQRARRLFFASLIYLPVVLTVMLIDKL